MVCVGIDKIFFLNINLFFNWFNFLPGTKDYCKKCEADCIESINNSLKKNNKEEWQKSGSTKAALVDNVEKQKNYEIDLLKQEVDDYKVKNSKLQNELKQKEKQIEFLQNKSSQNELNDWSFFWGFFLKNIFKLKKASKECLAIGWHNLLWLFSIHLGIMMTWSL